MIGKMPPGTDPKARQDRFFGRVDEMEDLRAYVGSYLKEEIAAMTKAANLSHIPQGGTLYTFRLGD
jgi:hypothetical protein